MIAPRPQPPPIHDSRLVRAVGCVSYLNSKPLIDGFEALGDRVRLRLDVPARLLADLESRAVDLALCPIVDYFRSDAPLMLVPVGGICCDGPTLTVRLFSRVPIERVTAVHADAESHTSVALLRVLLAELYGLRPRLIPFNIQESHDDLSPQSMLLIGDKVVTASPPAILYPHQLDLGEAWRRLTGLPFVFATWMARRDADLGDLPDQLETLRNRNLKRVDEIVDAYAAPHGWPVTLAREYLGRILRYTVGPRELAAVERFAELAVSVGVIDNAEPLRLWTREGASAS